MTTASTPLSLSGTASSYGWRLHVQRVLFLAVVGGLVVAPFAFPGVKAIDAAARIAIFIVVAASYDLLLGYTGIVSFAHTVFFGLGAYSVAIATNRIEEPGFGALAIGAAAGVAISMLVALVIGLFSLRVKAVFYSMITLAVASFFALLVAQLSDLTGGVDGMRVEVPSVLKPSFKVFEALRGSVPEGQEAEPVRETLFGVKLTGRIINYYLVLAISAGLFAALLRVVRSPFGKVLQAIRENPFRAEAIGYRTVNYRVMANCLAAGVAALAGVLAAVWSRLCAPESTVSFDIMVNVLLMVVIGGMGTLHGAALGAVIMVIAQSYLKELMGFLSERASGVPVLASALHPDHWLLWLGVLFILSVYFFPRGIIGKLRAPGA